jgi:ATP-dependent DNA helicase MPH1
VLLIADEAHKAQGNYAYCNAVAKMASLTPYFRVLALSATPGSKSCACVKILRTNNCLENVETIQSVICNLLISGMSVRTDEDVDVKSYIHSKQLDVVKVQLGHAITQVREAFLKVASIPINELVNQNCFYTRNVSKVPSILFNFGLLNTFLKLTRGAVFSACQRFRQSPPKNIEEHHKPQIEALFGVSTTLFHAWDLLNNHSISQFRTTITDLKNKEALKKVSRFHMELVRTEEFQHLLEVLEEVIESGSIDHPKLKAVERIINEHFEQNESEETRVMLFVEYRESVELITNLLKNYEPRVKPSQFVGQASGKTKGYERDRY